MDFLKEEIQEIEAHGLMRTLKSVQSGQGPEIVIDGRKVINFCSNNYLGLADDPRLVEAGVEAMRKYGAGSGAARLISGNFELHDALESELATFKGTDAALLFNSGYHANIGVIPALAGEGDVIFSDELNHASLIDGCRLSKAKTIVYRHNDLNHLESLLKDLTRLPSADTLSLARRGLGRGRILIITESLFSMEGDLCPLPDLLGLAKKYGAIVYLDEAHAVGVFGDHGEGLAPKGASTLLVSMGTLGKAFGSYGAFVAGSRTLKEYLINKARSFIFTTALPPPAVGASLAALKIVREEPERRERLWENIKNAGRVLSLRESFVGGLNRHQKASLAPPDLAPIISIKIGPADRTMQISRRLFEEGIYIQGIRPPTVPEGTSRLRLTVTATHTEDQIGRLIACLKDL